MRLRTKNNDARADFGNVMRVVKRNEVVKVLYALSTAKIVYFYVWLVVTLHEVANTFACENGR